MFITAVICGRNDNYGGFLNERATFSINALLETYDEVVYVDWNTESGKRVLTDELDLKHREKLKVIEVTPSMVKDIMGDVPSQPMCEVMARNIGIRRASGDIVVSTNPDIIPPERKYLNAVLNDLRDGDMFTFAKQDIELQDLDKLFGQQKTNIISLLPAAFGVWPIHKRLMTPFLTIDREMIEKHDKKHHHTLASVICACGDMQVATKNTWHTIRGFEESLKKRGFADTGVQYKVIMAGGVVKAMNFPPVYHIEHERDALSNSIDNMPAVSENHDDWGCALKIKLTLECP
jgi:hypothetical protein